MPPRLEAEIAGPLRCVAIVLLSLPIIADAATAQQPARPKTPAVVAPQPAKPNAAADSGKCVGVVSAIGDTLSLRKIGFTVFNNESNTVPVDSWQIDNLVIGRISAFLSKTWTVRRINYPKGAFASLDEKHPLLYNYDDDLRGIVRRVSSSTQCAHYVVVGKGSSQYSSTNQSLYGLGVLETGAPLRTGDFIYALYSIRVYDGQSFAVLGRRDGVTEQPNLLSSIVKPIHGPYLVVDTSWWPESGAAPSAMVRDGIRSLVEKSLDVTMPLILRIECVSPQRVQPHFGAKHAV
jgi:hypothetical protein